VKAAKAVRRRKSRRAPIKLTAHEKMLVTFYNAIPPKARESVDAILWAHMCDERDPVGLRYPLRPALRRVHGDRLTTDDIDRFAAFWRTQPETGVER
jgi:hypothetical protein